MPRAELGITDVAQLIGGEPFAGKPRSEIERGRDSRRTRPSVAQATTVSTPCAGRVGEDRPTPERFVVGVGDGDEELHDPGRGQDLDAVTSLLPR